MLVNRNTSTDNKLNIYPGIDIAFRPNNTTRIYASANRAMRLPTFTDLYYEDPSNIGNPDLKPERSAEYELGTMFTTGVWNARVNYFYRHITDAIDWIWLDDHQKWHTVNHTDLHTHGISAGGQWNVGREAFSAYYTFMHSEKSVNQYVSGYEMNYLRHKLNFGITHRIIEKVNAHWQIGWQDRNGSYMHFNGNDLPPAERFTETPFEPFWQIDLRIYRQTERFNIFVEASNLANKQHQDIGNVTLPGRWIRAGVAFVIL